MKLALIYGGKSQKIAETVKTIKDNLDIDCFKDIPEFIDTAIKRQVIYDRLLMPTTVVTEHALGDLEQFWRTKLYNTSIVLLCKTGKDEAIGTYFKEHFVSTNVCAMFVDATQKNSTVLSDAIKLAMPKLNEKYGLNTSLNLQDDDAVEMPMIPQPSADFPMQPQPMMDNMQMDNMQMPNMQMDNMQMPNAMEETPQKKGIKGLFVKKRATNTGMQQQNQMQQPLMQQQNPMQQEQMGFQLNMPNMSNWPTPESVMPELQNANMMPNMSMNNGFSQDLPMGDGFTPNIPMDDDFASMQGFSMEMPSSNDMSGANPSMQVDMPLDFNNIDNNQQLDSINEGMLATETPSVSNNGLEQENVDIKTENTEALESKLNLEEIPEDDFGQLAMGNFVEPSVTEKLKGADVEEVSEDLGGIDLGTAESMYRQQNEQPKVITKEVIREVVRDSGGGGGIVQSILNGKNPHILIVTGDRGTGITSTCLSIASFFAKKTSVLYFDCDTKTHGVLSYINYEEFRNFEPTKMSGTRICKSSKVFDNCVCKFDDNFDIISADYSVDVTDEELTCTAGVIAEKVVDYGLVIVDCPAEHLHCISDLLISGNTIVCVDASKRGFMNMLCALESSPLSLRYKKLMVNKGILFVTKYGKGIDVKRIVSYAKSIYEPEGVDWLAMHSVPFMGNVDIKLLDRVFTK